MMLLFLIFLVLLAIAGKMLFGMALEVVGAVLGLLLILIIFAVKRRKQ